MSTPSKLVPGQRAKQRVAANVRAARAATGLSQEELGDLCGLHRTYVSQVERGLRNISIDNLERIAGALGVDVFDLLSGTAQTS